MSIRSLACPAVSGGMIEVEDLWDWRMRMWIVLEDCRRWIAGGGCKDRRRGAVHSLTVLGYEDR